MHKRIAATVGALVLSGASFAAIAPAASAAPPVGGCPPGYTLETVAFVVAGAHLSGPDPSMDPNGDGFTCLELIDHARATWHDNNFPL
jgi:hypothetical protein